MPALSARQAWHGSNTVANGDLMELDDELCLCFHVTKRKVVNYLRIEQPRRVAQLADCHGAGTGCGWCRPYLKKLFDAARRPGAPAPDLPAQNEYARGRSAY